MTRLPRPLSRPGSAKNWAWRFALLAILWWMISGGEWASWRWGLPAIVIASLVMPAPTLPLRPLAWLRFVPVALWLGLRGGIEVTLLACRPQLVLDTRLVEYRWQRLVDGPGRLFLATLINLIPGTLTVRIQPHGLLVHVLHYRDDTHTMLSRLECHVARLFPGTVTAEETP
ncbi:Na+/H+ antiporter subunit E [Billgrantia kenyensis]|uniref:Cation:proton antiporter n=1 Tax=Billgrantia kenyensis TaxID=321266 RepID=A0A7W0ACI4_9GAMM|nr:Na+/H+ antiporter subunit E [Halomonas kenyensis]MBA2777565.1 Na+/H+ antiporter subunit E [Halomonas kenyensis]MCG6660235.1 cation:proton antiporter [Halomonas kenyensis]